MLSARVAIVENSPFLAGYFGRFLRGRGLECVTFRPWAGGGLPDERFDAYVLTGDFHNVTDGLKSYHKKVACMLERVEGSRVFGSCFSHQLIAHLRGGRVERRGRRLLGFEKHSVTGNHPVLEGASSFMALSMNTDEVTEAPRDAAVIASSAGCPFQVLSYNGGDILTCQAHPELGLLRGRAGVDLAALLLAGGPGAAFRRYLRSRGPDCARDSESFMERLASWLACE